MALAPSTRVGPYEIVCLIGEGGMGEVYKALDTRLDRFVAIKFSQERFSERFLREARAIAALNHPNICQIHDIGPDYLVMEHVEGSPPGPVDSNRRLLDIAVQIADGLAAAHALGFVHRDLKPDNILITHDGRVKILDFGVTKHLSSGTGAVTASMTSTAPGRVVGTAAWMSPEQARGETVDARSDQFSFGLVLYEMAAGHHPLQRSSAAETMAAIIREEPPPLPTTVPVPMRWVIERCLAKDPADRYESTRDLYCELRTMRDHLSEASVRTVSAGPHRLTRRAWLMTSGIGAALAAGAAGGALWERSRIGSARLWSGVVLGGPRVALGPRISPDGQLLAFVAMVDGQTQVAVMKPDAGSWMVLTSQVDGGSVLNLAWAPDGAHIYFDRYWDKPRGVYMVPPLGGEPILVLENAAAPLPLPDGSLVVLRAGAGLRDQMYRFWPESGRLQSLPAYVAFWRLTGALRATPDGRNVIFLRTYAGDGATAAPTLCALELASGRVRALTPSFQISHAESEVLSVAMTPDGRSVLFGQHLEDNWRVTSAPLDGGGNSRVLLSLPAASALWHMDMPSEGTLYLDQVARPMSLLHMAGNGGVPDVTPFPQVAMQSFVPLEDGRVLFTALESGRRRLMLARPGGEPRRFLPIDDENGAPFSRIGADGVAFLTGGAARPRVAIASLRDGRILRQLPFDAAEVRSLSASPDGGAIYYAAGNDVWRAPSDGSAPPRRIIEGSYVAADPGGRFLYVKQLSANPIRILRVPLDGAAPEAIHVPGDLRLTIQDFSPGAIDAR
ncbi:MAG TPA: protein kinase, partial [Bryobacteraceae bacterium]|nr:protein kinase [Bryobacteraceae bacterium]